MKKKLEDYPEPAGSEKTKLEGRIQDGREFGLACCTFEGDRSSLRS